MIASLFAVVLIYPSVAREGINLLDGAKWTGLNAEPGIREYAVSRGGPFSGDDVVRKVNTLKETYGYWDTSVTVLPGREYIAGYWVRFGNARTLFWTHGKNAATGKKEDFRLYCWGGIKKYLNPYFSDEIRVSLGGDPFVWKACFRMLKFPHGLVGNRLWIDAGCYTCEGEMEFAEPYLIDVTDSKDFTLTVDVRDSKPVSRLELFRVGINDVVWSRHFDRPVTEAKIKIPGEVADWRLGQEEDKNVIQGHGLDVHYADGTSERIFAPQEHVFRVRTDG
jgi:hypothetical protein